MSKIILLILIVMGMLIAYRLPVMLKSVINPKQSALNLLLFFITYTLLMMLLIGGFGFCIIHFKEFFFKR